MPTFPLIDLHQDLLAHLNHLEMFPRGTQTDFDMLKRQSTKIVTVTAFPIPPQDDYLNPVTNDLIEQDFEGYLRHTITDPSWVIIKNAHDLQRVLASHDLHGLLLHIEGLNVVSDADWPRLERWYDMGWRSLGLVWNLNNPLGGGTLNATQGLTDLGRRMLAWMQERHMIVDLAHMNRPTFWDALKATRGPVLISHGNCCRFCPSPRNYDDDQLRAIAERDGVIGAFFANTYVVGKNNPGTIADVANHIDHMVTIAGMDHVALGTDFGGIITGLIQGLESLDHLPVLWDELSKRGYTDENLEKIAWKNAARVLYQII